MASWAIQACSFNSDDFRSSTLDARGCHCHQQPQWNYLIWLRQGIGGPCGYTGLWRVGSPGLHIPVRTGERGKSGPHLLGSPCSNLIHPKVLSLQFSLQTPSQRGSGTVHFGSKKDVMMFTPQLKFLSRVLQATLIHNCCFPKHLYSLSHPTILYISFKMVWILFLPGSSRWATPIQQHQPDVPSSSPHTLLHILFRLPRRTESPTLMSVPTRAFTLIILSEPHS